MIYKRIRFCDVLISIMIIIIFLPLMILISFFLIIFNGTPIIFSQIRVGYEGRKFNIYKFRTMSETIFKDEKLRLTFFGKILRRLSLDELPQLINVLKKDMSLVGPRPLPEEIEKKINISSKKKRRKVLPGITGISQVNYSGKKRELDEKVELDLQFVDNYSLYNYFKVLAKTPVALMSRFYKNKSSIIK